MLTRIFLSHADTDVDLARLLHDELRRANPDIEVFVSSIPGVIPTGEEWLSEIKRQLKAADAYLILLTPASVQRLWVWFESGAAFMSDKKFIGVCAPGMQKNAVPSPLSGHQLLSLHSTAECEQVFREFSATAPDSKAFLEAVRIAAEKGTKLFSQASGWIGVQQGERYFAWDGPLDSMEDRDALVCPAGLTDAILSTGMVPTFGNAAALGKHLSDGRLQVFLTDQKSWRRPVINDGKQLLLVHASVDIRPTSFDKARELQERERANERKTRMLFAETGVNAAVAEFLKLSDEIARIAGQIGAPLSVEQHNPDGVVVYYARQFRVTAEWYKKFTNTLNESMLIVAVWKGYKPHQHDRTPPLRETHFQLDVAANGEYAWRMDGDGEPELFNNIKLADWCVKSLLDHVAT